MKRFLPKSIKNPKGFTLVELLVVISIIAILSVIGITLFNGVQKNGRDTKRKGDIDAISKALETNYVSGSATPYQAVTPAMFASGAVPTDPQNTGTFVYSGIPAAAAATYMVCAQLESPSGNATTNAGLNLGGSGATYTFYCKKAAQ